MEKYAKKIYQPGNILLSGFIAAKEFEEFIGKEGEGVSARGRGRRCAERDRQAGRDKATAREAAGKWWRSCTSQRSQHRALPLSHSLLNYTPPHTDNPMIHSRCSE